MEQTPAKKPSLNTPVIKYLYMKFDEVSFNNLPVSLEDIPPIFNPDLSGEQVQELTYVKLEGNAWDIEFLRQILLTQNNKPEEIC